MVPFWGHCKEGIPNRLIKMLTQPVLQTILITAKVYRHSKNFNLPHIKSRRSMSMRLSTFVKHKYRNMPCQCLLTIWFSLSIQRFLPESGLPPSGKVRENFTLGKVREKCAEKVRQSQGIQIELTGGNPAECTNVITIFSAIHYGGYKTDSSLWFGSRQCPPLPFTVYQMCPKVLMSKRFHQMSSFFSHMSSALL